MLSEANSRRIPAAVVVVITLVVAVVLALDLASGAHLREQSAAAHRLFEEFAAIPATASADAADTESIRGFEARLFSRLLILRQESLADAFRLNVHATGGAHERR